MWDLEEQIGQRTLNCSGPRGVHQLTTGIGMITKTAGFRVQGPWALNRALSLSGVPKLSKL